jgi:AcrR family transcriptional regulator
MVTLQTGAPARAARRPLQPRAVRTRARLVEAGQHEFSERGYAGATARSIARRAGSATGSFYQYFADKDALLCELASERLRCVADRALAVVDGHLGTPRDRVRAMVRIVVDYHREDPGLHAVLSERRHADRQLDELTSAAELSLVRRIGGLLERWRFAGDAEATAFVLFSMIEGAVHAHVLGAEVVSDERFMSALLDAVLAVLGPGRVP